MKICRIFLALSVLILAGCSKALDIELDPEVDIYLSSDSERKLRLTSKDETYVDLNMWLREHRSSWHSTSGRYPGGVYLKSGSYGIQITDSHVVLYSTTSSQPKAIYIQKMDKGELSGIRSLGK